MDIKVNNTTELIKMTRLIAWQLGWSQEHIADFTRKMVTRGGTFDSCLDVVEEELGEHITIKRGERK